MEFRTCSRHKFAFISFLTLAHITCDKFYGSDIYLDPV